MNCERNICYQQEYNGGCDTCPCNRTTKEAIENLKKLKSFHNGSYGSSIRIAIEALEKQVPKKVKYKNRHGQGYDIYNKDYYNCPSCGRRLRNKQKDNYCGRCGQAIDWSDADAD